MIEESGLKNRLYTREEVGKIVEGAVTAAVKDARNKQEEMGLSQLLEKGVGDERVGEVALAVLRASVRAGARNAAGGLVSFAFEVAEAYDAELKRRESAAEQKPGTDEAA